MNAVFWICAMVLFLIIEAVTPMLVSIWFALGALVAAILAYMGVGTNICVLTFAIVSAIAVVLFQKLFGDKFKQKHERTNADRLIGAKGVVETDIDPVMGKGTVLVQGNLWSAKSDGNIPSGCEVEVCAIEGVKLLVKTLEV
ncbi:MAG: NfeD family protein [Clostridia bacterium]|nr:NfeD family protein [Clostridia bacterium]